MSPPQQRAGKGRWGAAEKSRYLASVGVPELINVLLERLLSAAPPKSAVISVLRDGLDAADAEQSRGGGAASPPAVSAVEQRAERNLEALGRIADAADSLLDRHAAEVSAEEQRLTAARQRAELLDAVANVEAVLPHAAATEEALVAAAVASTALRRRLSAALAKAKDIAERGGAAGAGAGAGLLALPAAPTRQSLYVVRHGERVDDVTPGWVESAARPFDPPLTERGIDAARALGAALASRPGGERPVAVVSSPFLRCVETAAAVAGALRDAHGAAGAADVVYVHLRLGEVHSAQVLKHPRAPAFDLSPGGELSAAARRVAPGLAGVAPLPAPDDPPPFPEALDAAKARYSAAFGAVGDALLSRCGVLVTHGEAVGQSVADLLPGVTVYETTYLAYTQRSRAADGGAWALHTATGESGVQWMELYD